MRWNRAVILLLGVVGLGLVSCNRHSSKTPSAGQVVIYSSIDEPYLTPLVKQFEQETGIEVRLVTDSEATKTAGLVEKIEAEKGSPRADVYWGNEIFHTINLADQGIFDPYRPKTAEDVPAKWRGKNDLWTDIGLRARMIAVSTRPEYQSAAGKIKSLQDLADPALKGKIGICHPGFGTASGHIAALYVVMGPEKFKAYMQALSANQIKLLGGNSVVADQVAAGNLIAGPTDNDDINNARAQGQKIDGVLPDQDGMGTLLIPSTIALVHGAPHGENGKKLIDFLCRSSVEKGLIDARYFLASVRQSNPPIKGMDVDYEQCARQMRTAVETALTILQERQGAK